MRRLLTYINKKKHKGIIVYGSCTSYISKKAFIDSDSFSFNIDWNQGNIFKKHKHGYLELNDNCKFISKKVSMMHSGSTLVVFEGATLSIGEHVNFNNDCEIYCSRSITIGDATIFSNRCIIRDSDIHMIEGKENTASISIGNHVWVGTNVIILKGVTIGDGVVIGAGSVVTKNIPANCLAVGNPAKVIKRNIVWKR